MHAPIEKWTLNERLMVVETIKHQKYLEYGMYCDSTVSLVFLHLGLADSERQMSQVPTCTLRSAIGCSFTKTPEDSTSLTICNCFLISMVIQVVIQTLVVDSDDILLHAHVHPHRQNSSEVSLSLLRKSAMDGDPSWSLNTRVSRRGA